jgi:hypothetical protein
VTRTATIVITIAAAITAAGCGFQPGADDDDTPPVDAPPIDGIVDAVDDGDADRDGQPPPPPDATVDAAPGPILREAETYDALTSPQGHDWLLQSTIPSHSGAGYMYLSGGDGSPCTMMIETCGASMVYQLSIAADATYHVHLRMWADDSATDSVWVGFDGTPNNETVDVTENGTWQWASQPTATHVLTAGAHTLHVWHREGGANVDIVAVTPSATPPP